MGGEGWIWDVKGSESQREGRVWVLQGGGTTDQRGKARELV